MYKKIKIAPITEYDTKILGFGTKLLMYPVLTHVLLGILLFSMLTLCGFIPSKNKLDGMNMYQYFGASVVVGANMLLSIFISFWTYRKNIDIYEDAKSNEKFCFTDFISFIESPTRETPFFHIYLKDDILGLNPYLMISNHPQANAILYLNKKNLYNFEVTQYSSQIIKISSLPKKPKPNGSSFSSSRNATP